MLVDKARQKLLESESHSFEVAMPYIPNLSANHYKYSGGRYTKPEVKEWMETLKSEAQIHAACIFQIGQIRDVKVSISGTFQNERSMPDLHNLLKIILDSVAPALAINDKYIRTETDIPQVEKRDYGIFFGKVENIRATGEIRIKVSWK